MSTLRNLRNAESDKWFLILICNTLISLLAARNAAAITAAPVTAATDAIAATNYRNTRNYEQAAAAMTAALTAAAALPLASTTTTKASTKDYAQQLTRYREIGASAASAASLRDVRNANSAVMPIYRNYFENNDDNSDKIDATAVDFRDQMVEWRTPHAGGGRVPEVLADESAAMTAAGFVPTTMTAAGQHYADSMNGDVSMVTALGSVRVGADFSANAEADGNSFGGSFAYATPSGKIDYEFKEDNYESAGTGESDGGNAASEGRGKSLSTVSDVDGVYKYDMGEYAGFPVHIDNANAGEDARFGKASAGVATANQGGGVGASYYENHLPNYENYFMPTYQIEQFSNYHNQATEPAQAAEEQVQFEGQALELEQRKAVEQKASVPHGHVEQPQLRPLTLLNGGDAVDDDDDNNAAMLQQFNKGVNIENYANDRQKLRYYVKQPQMQKEQQQQKEPNVEKLQQQQQQRSTQSQILFQQQQQQQNLQQQHDNLQQQLNIQQQQQHNLQPQLHLQQKHNIQQQLNLQQQNLQELQQNPRQQQQQQHPHQQNSQQHYQLVPQKHKQQLLLPHHFRKLPEFLHYSLPQRWPRPQTRQVKTLSKATRPNYHDALSTRRRRQQKRDATSLQVIGSSEAARTRYSLLPTMRNFHTLDSDNAGDTTNAGDIISSNSPSSPGSRTGGYKRSISEIFADNANAPTQYSYVRVYPSPHVSHLIDDSVNEIDDTHNNIDDSNGRQQQNARDGNSGDEEEHDDGNISHRDVQQQHFIQTLSQPTVKSYQLHNSAHTLPPITTSVRHTPASSAALAGIPLARHVEVTKHIAAVDYERIHVPYNQSVPIRIPQPIITTIPRPYAIRVPVSKTIAVPKVQEVRIPIEKVKPFPVERPVPFVVERRVPYMVEKQVAKPVYYPYPVKVPIVKTIVHKVTRRPHTYATYQPHASSYPISLGQYHLQQPHLGAHTLPSSVHYTHSTEHLG